MYDDGSPVDIPVAGLSTVLARLAPAPMSPLDPASAATSPVSGARGAAAAMPPLSPVDVQLKPRPGAARAAADADAEATSAGGGASGPTAAKRKPLSAYNIDEGDDLRKTNWGGRIGDMNRPNSSQKLSDRRPSKLNEEFDDMSLGESLIAGLTTNSQGQPATAKDYVAKTVVLLAGLALLIGGACLVSGHDASVVDYDYGDSTTTIFFDGLVCTDGRCRTLESDPWVCSHMLQVFRTTRVASVTCGGTMCAVCLLFIGSLFSRVLSRSCRRCARCIGDDSACVVAVRRARDSCSRLLPILGFVVMVALLGLAIAVIKLNLRVVYEPMCDSYPYNASLSESAQFSFGRGMHLNLGGAISLCVVEGSLVLWACGYLCCHWDEFGEDEQSAERAEDDDESGYARAAATDGSSPTSPV